MKEKLLITGISGGVGRLLATRLLDSNKYIITGVSRNATKSDSFNGKVHLIDLDLMDQEILESVVQDADIVIHTAALISYKVEDKEKLMNTNFLGTAMLINACLECKVKYFIHVSSSAALGTPPHKFVLDETHVPQLEEMELDYGLSKWLGELEVWRGFAEGLQGSIVAPSIVIGPEELNLPSNSLRRELRGGMKYHPSGSYGFVHCDDVTDAIVRLLDAKPIEQKYLLNGVNLSWKTFYEKLAHQLNLQPPSKRLNNLHIWLVGLSNFMKKLTGKKSLTSIQLLNQFQFGYKFDGTKSVDKLGIKYRDILS